MRDYLHTYTSFIFAEKAQTALLERLNVVRVDLISVTVAL